MKEEQKNKNFVQFYKNYMGTVTTLAVDNPTAFRVFMLICQHMDGTNALCVSMLALSEILNTSRQTISKSVKYLKDNGWMCVLKNGTSNVYIINPQVVWTSYGNQKDYCKFQASVLLSSTENAEYLNNPKAKTHFKTINDNFIKSVQSNKEMLEEQGKIMQQM